jgi:pilus assembly protein Flp/PilA
MVQATTQAETMMMMARTVATIIVGLLIAAVITTVAAVARDRRCTVTHQKGNPGEKLTQTVITSARFIPYYSEISSPGDCFMLILLTKLFKNEDGATAIEYGLIAALISIAAVTIMGTVGSNLTSVFTTVAGDL